MAWNDAPPTKEELARSSSTASWDSAPPTPEELGSSSHKTSAGEMTPDQADKYIKSKSIDWSDPYKIMPEMDERAKDMKGGLKAGLESYGNALTSGYLPQLQAGAEKITDPLFSKLTGQKVDPEDYVKSRDENIDRQQAEEKEYPKSSMVGRLAGTANQALAIPLPGALAPKSLGGALVKGAGVGAGYGLLQNPGDVKGQVDPLQLSERAQNAKSGARTGAVAGPVTYGIAKVLNGLANSGQSLNNVANEAAVSQTGAMLKDFRQLEGKDQTQEFGQFLRDNGLVKSGESFSDVAKRSEDLQDSSGKALENIYNKTKEALPQIDAENSKNWPSLPKEEFEKAASVGFSPVRDKDQILNEVKSRLGDSVKAKSATKAVSDYLDEMGEKYGEAVLDPRKANDIKSAMDKEINYARNPLTKSPETETAFSAARNAINKKVIDHIDYIGKASGNADLAQQLKDANKSYGFSKKAADIANDYVNRQNANSKVGLINSIAGGAGSVAGGLAGTAAMSGDSNPYHRGGAALAAGVGTGLLTGLASKYGRNYGAGRLAGAAGALSEAAPYTLEPIGKVGAAIPQEIMLRGILNKNNNKKEK